MRCNACWRELEGRAVSTTCGHLLCSEDASRILSNDAACPICDQVLSISLMKPVDMNPNDEWINMAMAGVSPQILMKSAYRSVMFYIAQRDREVQYKMNKVVGQCQQKCEAVQEKFTDKLEQVHTAYLKMAKRCLLLEQENENLSKNKQELQEKFSEKSRQKRKLDEMYESLRNEYVSVKRSTIQPVNNFTRAEPHTFSSPAKIMENRDLLRQGEREDVWPQPQTKSSNSGPFDIPGCSPGKPAPILGEANNRRVGRPTFGVEASNPTMTLQNLILSPMKRPRLSRNRPNMFT
ncbi:E3 ubiquitin-protein ligase CCNB1IP1 homolog [Aristolochia californica]|uniref:E3 ubiquitin-protein ligase CCNB1IP1 homolog n=1 Tax=Aristolochia californica TaxID=171875 RepID=UPI0035D6DF93